MLRARTRSAAALPGAHRDPAGRPAVRGRRRSPGVVLLLLVVLGAGLLGAVPPAAAAPGDVGTEGLSHAGTGTPTGTKRAESVLWFNDGHWWGNLWDTATSDFHIFRFDAPSGAWVDTGVATEKRSNTHHDVLWDGNVLHVASHKFVNDGVAAAPGYPTRLYRYGYDPGTDTYTPLDTTQINDYRTETLVIDKDSTGRVWATWQQGNQVWLNVTGTDGKTWGEPFPHPATADPASRANVSIDDTSALIAFGPGRMGLMWSRQTGDDTDGFYWSVHEDTAAPDVWSYPEPVVTGRRSGDDHMNLKWLDSSGGQVFAAVKTSFGSAAQPLIQLLRMTSEGSWSAHTIATVAECPNRVILLIDEAARQLRTFATYPKPGGTTNAGTCSNSGGAIYEKSTPLDSIGFTTEKTVRILDADQYVHNVSSTKQNINNDRAGGASTAGSGVLVIADVNATSRYWHHYDGPGAGVTDTAPPTVSSVSPAEGATGVGVSTQVTATFSEAMDPSTVDDQTFTLRDDAGSVIPAGVSYDGASRTATLDPGSELAAGTSHSATIAGVADLAGNALAADHVWRFTTAAPGPVASFTATPTSGEAPLTVQFTDTSSGTPTGWAWTFGDGATATEQHPVHTYGAAGAYEVTLTVSDATGASTTAATTITVDPPASGTEVVTVPVAEDSYVASGSPSRNYGTSASLWVDGTPVNISYLKFDLSPYAGRTVLGATLELSVTSNGSVGQQDVRAVTDDSWTETAVTYANRPALGDPLGTLGPTSPGAAHAVPLTVSVLQAELGQAASLGLDTSNGDAVGLVSGEGAVPPRLVLTLAS